MFKIKILIFSFLGIFTMSSVAVAAEYYVSTNGNDNNAGTQTRPFKTVSKAQTVVSAGDTIYMMPGTHAGVITFTAGGEPENPITIKSSSADPTQYAIIDGGGVPGNDGEYGIKLQNTSWVVIENLKFRNCWKEIIEVVNSNYITIRGNDFREGQRVIYSLGADTHHILAENNTWVQDVRLWTTWDWATVHDSYQYNGGFYTSKQGEDQGRGAAVIRNNTISYAFNVIWMQSSSLNKQANNEIYGNKIDHIRDNAVEPEQNTFNLHIYHNIFNQISNGVFSIQGTAGGPIYLYGNVGYYDFNDPPHWNTGDRGQPNWRIFKMSNASDSKLDDTLHSYHNTWFYGSLTTDSGKSNRHWHNYNNIGVFKNGYKLDNYQFASWDNDFDYDFSDKAWPSSIRNNNQEQNGIVGGDPGLINPSASNFRLKVGSQLIDKGRVIPGFTQSYEGLAPDIGAYEGNKLVEGPPFYIQVPPGGLGYVEKPRITRHRVNGNELRIFWSWTLTPASISNNTVILKADGAEAIVNSIQMGVNNREVIITTDTNLENKKLTLEFNSLPIGENGATATLWASTLTAWQEYQASLPAPTNIQIVLN